MTEPQPETHSGPRTLADELRGRSDEELAALLRLRPDLLTPMPTDVTSLVARATTRSSVTRALERLDTFTLQVMDAFACLPDPTTYADILTLIKDRDHLGTAIDRLRELGLIWGGEDTLRIVRTVRNVIGPVPGETGPPLAQALGELEPARLRDILADLALPPPPADTPVAAVQALTDLFSHPELMAALLATAPPQAREVLDRLAAGPPVGRVERADRQVRASTARTPIEWLLARALLVAADQDTVVLPREVALHLRGGRLHSLLEPEPPGLDAVTHDPGLCDRTAAGAAFSTTRQVEDLLEAWSLQGPPVLRTGGLGLRELRRTAAGLDVDEPVAALYAEVAHAAGLLAPSEDVDEVWLPTLDYDGWRATGDAHRWVALARAWLDATRVPGLVGERDDRDRLFAALGPDLDRTPVSSRAPEVRRDVLEILAGLPPGSSAGADAVVQRLRWYRPRRTGPLWSRLVHWTLREAELLGLTGRGALSGHGRALLAGDPARAGSPTRTGGPTRAAATLAPLLPTPTDHVLLQADLTAVAPGPLTRELARALALVADVESTGGATVYRFGEASVRRALDAGCAAADLHRLLAEHSRTPVPQPLGYLIDDVARRHGRIRVGTASSYVRCDDEALLTELLADRRAADLTLRRLAPTVLASPLPVDMVLERLRALGYPPVAESLDGDVLITRPDSRRTPNRPQPVRGVPEPPPPDLVLLNAAVKAIRAGERVASAGRRAASAAMPPGASGVTAVQDAAREGGRNGTRDEAQNDEVQNVAWPPRTTPAESLAVLRRALSVSTDEERLLWIGYVNAEGRASQRVIEPIKVEGGYVTAFDHAWDEVRTFAIHRITGMAALPKDEVPNREVATDPAG